MQIHMNAGTGNSR